MDKKLKIAIVGAGGIAYNAHGNGYLNIENIEVIGVCDIIKERAQRLADKLGAKFVCEDYRELFNLEGLDAIDICTPNYLHSVIAVDSLNRGFHVFCEKPDAVSVEEALKMKEASEKNNKVLMVMRNNRYLGAAKYLKKFIADGKMGDIYAARCGWQRRRGIPGKGGWFTTKEKSGGGPLIDLGVHMIDLTMWLMGNPTPVSVSGSTYCKFANSEVADNSHTKTEVQTEGCTFDVEDLAMGFIKFDNGACMQLEFSWASNIGIEKRFFELRGDKAGAEWYSTDEKLKIYTEEYGDTVDIIPNIKTPVQIHEANLRHFADVVLNGAKPQFVPQQGVDMIKVLCAIYESAKTGKEVLL